MKNTLLFIVFILLFSSCSTITLIHKNNKAYKLIDAHKNIEALGIYDEILPTIKSLYGKYDTSYYTQELLIASTLEYEIGHLQKAEKLTLEIYDIYQYHEAYNNETYANCCLNMGVFFALKGKYLESLYFYQEALSYYEKHPNMLLDEYGKVLFGLATNYADIEEYNKSEYYYQKAKNTLKDIYGEKSDDYSRLLINMGVFYLELNNLDKALEYFLESYHIKKNLPNLNPLNISNSLNNLSIIYLRKIEYKKSIEYQKENLHYIESTLGKKSKSYVYSLLNLGILYNETEKYKDTAGTYIDKAVLFCEDAFENSDMKKARMFLSASDYYYKTGKNKQAKSLLNRSISLYKTVFGTHYPQKEMALFLYAKTAENELLFDTAFHYYQKALAISDQNIERKFAFLSEKENEKIIQKNQQNLNYFYSYVFRQADTKPELLEMTYNTLIRNKGILLKSSTALKNAILKSNNKKVIELYEQWLSTKKQIANLYAIPENERKDNLIELENLADKYEKVLVKNSLNFNHFFKDINYQYSTIKNQLNSNEVAIEFVHFDYYNKIKTDSILYCALIIKAESDYPELVPLFEEKELKKIIGTHNGNDYDYINKLYGSNYKTNTALYDLIWQPLEKSIKGKEKIYLSPSGLLLKLNFSAFAKQKKVFLCDLYSINILSNTRSIHKNNTEIKTDISSTASLFGGINYNIDSNSTEIWKYLEGTFQETISIKKIMTQGGINVNLYSKNEATEEKFKQIASESSILHIATHGFFYPNPIDTKKELANTTEYGNVEFRGVRQSLGVNSFIKNLNPLMRSGLVLAGANKVWNIKNQIEGEDGVLTAQEVAHIDMQNTELAIMSACETGLGDIKGSEGVFGLQRAFKMAGAKCLIMSLWQVPDKETAEFMTLFYNLLFETKDINLAFTQTQKKMCHTYPPYFWGAFVLIQ